MEKLHTAFHLFAHHFKVVLRLLKILIKFYAAVTKSACFSFQLFLVTLFG